MQLWAYLCLFGDLGVSVRKCSGCVDGAVC